MDLCDVKPNKARHKSAKRKGRGIAAGQGKTCGRGESGQKHRFSIKPGFEGGQTPLYRRLPKLRGQSNKAHNIGIFRKKYQVVNVRDLERFAEGTAVSPQLLLDSGLLAKIGDGVKILGNGELSCKLEVRAHAIKIKGRKVVLSATLSAEGEVCARGEVVAVRIPEGMKIGN